NSKDGTKRGPGPKLPESLTRGRDNARVQLRQLIEQGQLREYDMPKSAGTGRRPAFFPKDAAQAEHIRQLLEDAGFSAKRTQGGEGVDVQSGSAKEFREFAQAPGAGQRQAPTGRDQWFQYDKLVNAKPNMHDGYLAARHGQEFVEIKHIPMDRA